MNHFHPDMLAEYMRTEADSAFPPGGEDRLSASRPALLSGKFHPTMTRVNTTHVEGGRKVNELHCVVVLVKLWIQNSWILNSYIDRLSFNETEVWR